MEIEIDDGDQFAPMADALSCVLCVLVLVVSVFMFSLLGAANSSLVNAFPLSVVDADNKKITFVGGVQLNRADAEKVRRSIKDGAIHGRVKFYGVMGGRIANADKKILFNMLEFKRLVAPDMRVLIARGEESECGDSVNCIYWRFE